jgi:hypothetical protein
MYKTFNFQKIDHDIYVTTMDASTVRQNIRQCNRCKSIWHIVQDCPFAEDGVVAPGTRQAQTTVQPTKNNQWFSEILQPDDRVRSIAWRELFAVVIKCRIWGHLFVGRRMLLYCDNQSVVEIVNSGTSRCPLVMCLVRSLYFLAGRFNVDVKLRHVPGLDNKAADLLSRDAVQDFLAHYGACYVNEPTMASHDFYMHICFHASRWRMCATGVV